MTPPKQPLIYRYTILKRKLGDEVKRLELRKKLYGSLSWEDKRYLQLYRQSLNLLIDTYNGEDIDLT